MEQKPAPGQKVPADRSAMEAVAVGQVPLSVRHVNHISLQ